MSARPRVRYLSSPPDLTPSVKTSARVVRSLRCISTSVLYARPAEGFAYLTLGTARLMLEQIGLGRTWEVAPLTPPLGRCRDAAKSSRTRKFDSYADQGLKG